MLLDDEGTTAPLPCLQCEDSLAASPPHTTAWHVLRLWLYQNSTVREMTFRETLSALGAWKSGRPLARVSVVAGARIIGDPDQVSWKDFPLEEALEAEGDAPPPLALERATRASVPSRITRSQIDALRAIDRAPAGLEQGAVNSRSARALLNRGLITLSIVGSRTDLLSSSAGRALARSAAFSGSRSPRARFMKVL